MTYLPAHLEGVTQEGELIPLSETMGLRGRVLRVGWDLPADLNATEWKNAGQLLGKLNRSSGWWIGDWWAFGEKQGYGERKAIVQTEGWEGPDFQTCMNCASVSRSFETSRRREVLSFKHHAEVYVLPKQDADRLLDWCEREADQNGKPPPVLKLRAAVQRIKNAVGEIPSDETCAVDDLATLISRGRKFGTIYADPPWVYDNQGTRAATSKHYDGLTVDELCALPVRDLASQDAHLHLWITNAFLFDAPKIFDAWGFEFRSSFCWCKNQMGIGNYWRNSHELLLTAVRGDAKRFYDHSLVSWLATDRGAHSAKPEQVRSMIEKASPGPFLELFGRRAVHGWAVWGNQVRRDEFLLPMAESMA